MNKKFFVTAGALLLAVAGVFAGRAMRGPASTVYFTKAGVCTALLSSGVPSNFSTTGTHQATILSSGNVTRKLWTSGCSTAVYFKD